MKFLRFFVLGVCLFMGSACEDNEARSDGIVGAGVDIHCFNQTARGRQGIGDTNVDVTCPSGVE